MPPVQQLRDDAVSAAAAPKAIHARQPPPDFDQDRRVAGDIPDATASLDLGLSVANRRYPPAAVTALLIIEAIAIFVTGHLTAEHYGIGYGEGTFGPHELILTGASLLFPIAAIFQDRFARRAPRIAALWGMRVIAPLAVTLLISFAAFAALVPDVPLANSATMLLHWVGAWFVASYVTAGLLDTGIELLIRRREREGKSARRVVVFGGGVLGQRFIEALARSPVSGIRVEAFFDDRAKSIPETIADAKFGGGAEDLIAFVQHEAIDEIFIALPWSAEKRILEILTQFRPLPAPIRLAPDSALLHPALMGGDDTSLAPVIRQTPLSPWGQFLKTMVDRLIAAVALLGLSPILVVIALGIKLTSRGPILFRQQRLGFNNRPFAVYKFRSMRQARTADDTLRQAQRRDPRITSIGAFIRRWSLDELPQLLNVLRGDMSLVGPRPHPMWRQASDLWEQGGNQPVEAIIHEYAARHRVKPGITGWAQISGYRGETSTIERMHKRVELDIYYIDHWSLGLDFKIILRTFLTVFQTQDVY